MKRPVLKEINPEDIPQNSIAGIVQFSNVQPWDSFLQTSYDAGFLLAEFCEEGIKYYRKAINLNHLN